MRYHLDASDDDGNALQAGIKARKFFKKAGLDMERDDARTLLRAIVSLARIIDQPIGVIVHGTLVRVDPVAWSITAEPFHGYIRSEDLDEMRNGGGEEAPGGPA